jgi:hypothetical protein
VHVYEKREKATRKKQTKGNEMRKKTTHIQATIISIILGNCSLTLRLSCLEVGDVGVGGWLINLSALLRTNPTKPKIDFQFSVIQPGFHDDPVACACDDSIAVADDDDDGIAAALALVVV